MEIIIGTYTEWLIVHCFRIELEFGNCCFLWREERVRLREKPSELRARIRNNKILAHSGQMSSSAILK